MVNVNMDLFLGPVGLTLVLGGIAIVLLYRYSVRNFDYWTKRGIPTANTVPLLGSLYEMRKYGFHDLEDTSIKSLDVYMGRHYEGSHPALSVGDPKLLRDILSKDFSSFHERRPIESGHECFDKMMPMAQGEDWRRIRNIVSPTFSTGKIKRMLSIFKECAKVLCENCKSAMDSDNYVEIRKLYGTYSMDVIASAAFSTKVDSHKDPNNKFVRMARKTLTTSFSVRVLLYQMIPRLMKFFGVYIFEKEPADFFVNVTKQIVEERRISGKTRNDFLQLLIDTATEVSKEEEAEEKGDITENYEQEIEKQILKFATSKQLTMNELVAQCVIFFIAGYHTTAIALGFATHCLALNPKIQDRLRKEVDEALMQTNGEMNYEAIQGMKYLDNVISETLRLYPPGVRLERTANVDYELGDTGITIPKGMALTVPVFAIHRDPEYYPEPEKFDPDRFSPEERNMRDPYAYLPFGAGPRNCVGMRFALMEIKVCLAYVIAKFIIKKCPKTKEPLDFVFGQGALQAKEINVALEERKGSILKE